jgi:hypothetical protein
LRVSATAAADFRLELLYARVGRATQRLERFAQRRAGRRLLHVEDPHADQISLRILAECAQTCQSSVTLFGRRELRSRGSERS